jgi:hypothetical protein
MKDDLQAQSMAAAHARCWNLLPWWVNGTLPANQASDVERHLAECAKCTTELAVQRALQLQIRDGNPMTIAPQSAWLKMSERLASEDEALARGHFKSRPKATGVWHWAVAAQALIIVGLTTLLWQQTRSPDSDATTVDTLLQPRYETLTSSPVTQISHDGVRVVFRSGVALVDVNALLRELSAQIVAGPTEAEVYTLALASPAGRDSGKPESATAMLARLRADARVVFAEPTGSN